LKVLIVGDSPFAKTGFGRVNRHALEAFLTQGWEVGTVTGTQFAEVKTDLPVIQFVPQEGDTMGLKRLTKVLREKEFEPDVIYCTADTGSLVVYMQFIPADHAFVAYAIIEGEPIVSLNWRSALGHPHLFTVTKYAADLVKRTFGLDMDWVYHGVDHEVFHVDEMSRTATRESLGWDDKFVVMTVAQNVARKQHPRLIEAISELKHRYHQHDIILYDHTVPLQNYYLEGWNLHEVSAGYAVTDRVFFNEDMDHGLGSAIPERGSVKPGLADLYRAADLFVLPSQVEGFGLPIAEAMASGVPVVVTKYAGGWEVAQHGQGYGLPVKDWQIHKSGTRIANVDPSEIAKAILTLKRDPKRRARMRAAGLEMASLFDWDVFKEKVIRACEAGRPHIPKGQVEVQGEEAGEGSRQGSPAHPSSDDDVRQVAAEDLEAEASVPDDQGPCILPPSAASPGAPVQDIAEEVAVQATT
jgi:glycosyltransferase involved in cell wall biosynthesis